MKLSDRIEQMVHPMNSLPQELDSWLEHLFGQNSNPKSCAKQSTLRPHTNLVEREKDFVISMELPGVPVGDVTVEASDERLKISGEKKPVETGDSEKVLRIERTTGKFERTFAFPTQVDFEGITAEFQNGVLIVSVPKSERVLPRKIEISVTGE